MNIPKLRKDSAIAKDVRARIAHSKKMDRLFPRSVREHYSDVEVGLIVRAIKVGALSTRMSATQLSNKRAALVGKS